MPVRCLILMALGGTGHGCNSPRPDSFTRNHERRGGSNNEQFTGGVLSGSLEQIEWLPVESGKVWWLQRDLNPCLRLERTDESEENQQDDPSESSDD